MQPKRRKPTHPGIVLNEDFLKPLGISPAQFAINLGKNWNENKVNAIIHGKENISLKAAQELAQAFDIAPEFWIKLQERCHEWEHEKEKS